MTRMPTCTALRSTPTRWSGCKREGLRGEQCAGAEKADKSKWGQAESHQGAMVTLCGHQVFKLMQAPSTHSGRIWTPLRVAGGIIVTLCAWGAAHSAAGHCSCPTNHHRTRNPRDSAAHNATPSAQPPAARRRARLPQLPAAAVGSSSAAGGAGQRGAAAWHPPPPWRCCPGGGKAGVRRWRRPLRRLPGHGALYPTQPAGTAERWQGKGKGWAALCAAGRCSCCSCCASCTAQHMPA